MEISQDIHNIDKAVVEAIHRWCENNSIRRVMNDDELHRCLRSEITPFTILVKHMLSIREVEDTEKKLSLMYDYANTFISTSDEMLPEEERLLQFERDALILSAITFYGVNPSSYIKGQHPITELMNDYTNQYGKKLVKLVKVFSNLVDMRQEFRETISTLKTTLNYEYDMRLFTAHGRLTNVKSFILNIIRNTVYNLNYGPYLSDELDRKLAMCLSSHLFFSKAGIDIYELFGRHEVIRFSHRKNNRKPKHFFEDHIKHYLGENKYIKKLPYDIFAK